MKVKVKTIERKKLGIKDVRVNLIRLTKEKIASLLNTAPETNKINYNFSLKLSGNKWKCTSYPTSIAPVISNGNNIFISIRNTNADVPDVADVSSAASLNSDLGPTFSYKLRSRPPKENIPLKITTKAPLTTISELGADAQKKRLWDLCKKKVDKLLLIDGALVFAKQKGHSPWPSKIISMKKTSSTVKYYGYVDFRGTVKNNEMVPLNDDSKQEIGALVEYTLKTKSIRDFDRFNKAIKEISGAMKF